MLFESRDEMAEFFDKLEESPDGIEYGTAMYHARSAELGLWGDTRALRHDCARIMAVEAKRFLLEQFGIKKDITADDVEYIQHFLRAFDTARRPDRANMHNLVRSLGDNKSHMQEIDGDLSYEQNMEIAKVHERVATEILAESQREQL